MFVINVCLGGDILLDGPRFYPKPYSFVTITVWIKLDTNGGRQSLFSTIGGNSSTHRQGQYHLETRNGIVRWSHCNEREITIFKVLIKPLIEIGKSVHLAVTYDSALGIARVGLADSFSLYCYC